MTATYCPGHRDIMNTKNPIALLCLAFVVLFLGPGTSLASQPQEPVGVRADHTGQGVQPYDDAVLRTDNVKRVDRAAVRGNEEIKVKRQGSAMDGGRAIHIFNAIIGVVLAAAMVLCLIYLVGRKR
jgi:hypothetical protein